ncbi:Fc.00g009800.m01.CDS01 [Cosmosporella sp. VM-42]
MPYLREMCMFVLKHLPTRESIVLRPISPCHPDEWIHIAVNLILRSLHEDFDKYVQAGENGLEEMAGILSDNTSQPLKDNHADPYGWIDQFTGLNLRWESLGLLWTFWELGDGPLIPPVNPAKPPNAMIRICLGHCVDLARHFAQANDLLLYISYRRATIQSMISGDASLACSSFHAQDISLMTFLGLHAETETTSYIPSLCSENKRRMFAYIFNIDKVMVSFTGRPPLISRRYVSTPLPLDLQDKDLLGGDTAIQRAVEALDEQGWDVGGPVCRATLLRARAMIGFTRDEALEIALGPTVNATVDSLL